MFELGSQAKQSSQAAQFRAKAAGCFARSKDVQDPEYQRIFYDLAIEWLAMAVEADVKGAQPTMLRFRNRTANAGRP